jgi:hypothetical protein
MTPVSASVAAMLVVAALISTTLSTTLVPVKVLTGPVMVLLPMVRMTRRRRR